MKKHILMVFIIGGVASGMPAVSEASVITTATGIENFEWLEFSYTVGMSRDYVEENLLNTVGYEGYRYATRAETESLLSSYYSLDSLPTSNGFYTGMADAANSFLSDFGILQSFSYSPGYTSHVTEDAGAVLIGGSDRAYFLYGADEETLDSDIYSLIGRVTVTMRDGSAVSGEYGSRIGFNSQYSQPLFQYDTSGFSYEASLLVRDNESVPEPASMLLIASGLAGLYGVRLKK